MDTNRIFAGFYNFFTRFGVKKNRITLIEKLNTGGTGNLFSVRDEIQQRGDYEFNVITHKDYEVSLKNLGRLFSLFTRKCHLMATSSFLLLNDNFMPLADMKVQEETMVIQLWHGMGSFKKFGASTEPDPTVIETLEKANEKVDTVVVSAEGIRENYAEALKVPVAKIKALGNPQGDYYFQDHDLPAMKEKLYEQYPALAGKKLVLYAPTFRGDPDRDADILNHFDFGRFEEELGDDYVIAVRLHPLIRSSHLPEGVVDLSDYPNVRELLVMTDLLITDYSSIIVEYVLLDKPVILYAYDKDWYLTADRGFYHDYTDTAPGPIIESMDELIDCIKKGQYDHDRISSFAHLHNDHFDSLSATRVVDYMFRSKEGNSMKIIAGLGNPTDEYKGTRHNAGFMAIDRIAETYGIKINQCKFKALVGSGFIEGQRVLLMKPLTYMNRSGEAIRQATDFYKVEPEDVLVLYDDISLDPGMLRIRKKGSAGGHNGMKSIINHLGSEEFPRFRIGIGGEKHPDHDLVDFVLGRFSKEEMEKLNEVLEVAPKAAALIMVDEIDEAMNRYNIGKKKRAAKKESQETEE